jgi:hypothetical protein
MNTITVIANNVLRREIEHRLIVASFEVAPQLTDHERVAFVEEMLSTLSTDDAAAILID